MKLKAKLKWNGKDVLVEPILFDWHVGIQFKTITGPGAGSIFCNTKNEYIFPLQTKVILFFVKIWYWLRYWLWMQIRYWQPNRIKRIISKKETVDGLPF